MQERQTRTCFFRPIGCDASATSLHSSSRDNVRVSSQHKRAQLLLKGIRPRVTTGGYTWRGNLPFQPEPSPYTPKNPSILTLRASRICKARKNAAFKHPAPRNRRQCGQQVLKRWKHAYARPLYKLADGKLPSYVLLPDLDDDDEISQETDFSGASSLASTATPPRPIILQFRPTKTHSLVESIEMFHPFSLL